MTLCVYLQCSMAQEQQQLSFWAVCIATSHVFGRLSVLYLHFWTLITPSLTSKLCVSMCVCACGPHLHFSSGITTLNRETMSHYQQKYFPVPSGSFFHYFGTKPGISWYLWLQICWITSKVLKGACVGVSWKKLKWCIHNIHVQVTFYENVSCTYIEILGILRRVSLGRETSE